MIKPLGHQSLTTILRRSPKNPTHPDFVIVWEVLGRGGGLYSPVRDCRGIGWGWYTVYPLMHLSLPAYRVWVLSGERERIMALADNPRVKRVDGPFAIKDLER